MSKFDLFPSQQGKSFLIYGFSAGRSPCWRKILISRVCLSPGPLHHQSQLVRSLGEIQYLGTKIILDSAEYSTFTLLYYMILRIHKTTIHQLQILLTHEIHITDYISWIRKHCSSLGIDRRAVGCMLHLVILWPQCSAVGGPAQAPPLVSASTGSCHEPGVTSQSRVTRRLLWSSSSAWTHGLY